MLLSLGQCTACWGLRSSLCTRMNGAVCAPACCMAGLCKRGRVWGRSALSPCLRLESAPCKGHAVLWEWWPHAVLWECGGSDAVGVVLRECCGSGAAGVVLWEWCCGSGAAGVVLLEWCCGSGAVGVVLWEWCCWSGAVGVVLWECCGSGAAVLWEWPCGAVCVRVCVCACCAGGPALRWGRCFLCRSCVKCTCVSAAQAAQH